jgi:hypothetical protein
MPRIALLATPLLVALAATPAPADDSRSEPVYFAPGGTGVVIAGSLEGRETVDYLLGAKAGQTLSVTMDSDNSAAYFNLIAPNEQDVALYAGHLAAEPNRYEGTLDLDGEWKIRVYLYRAAADAGERADYRLDIHITGARRGARAQRLRPQLVGCPRRPRLRPRRAAGALRALPVQGGPLSHGRGRDGLRRAARHGPGARGGARDRLPAGGMVDAQDGPGLDHAARGSLDPERRLGGLRDPARRHRRRLTP